MVTRREKKESLKCHQKQGTSRRHEEIGRLVVGVGAGCDQWFGQLQREGLLPTIKKRGVLRGRKGGHLTDAEAGCASKGARLRMISVKKGSEARGAKVRGSSKEGEREVLGEGDRMGHNWEDPGAKATGQRGGENAESHLWGG